MLTIARSRKMLSTRVLTDWENKPQALWVNADFQWQLTQQFAIDLDRHSPIAHVLLWLERSDIGEW
jgi:hypothetical protein